MEITPIEKTELICNIHLKRTIMAVLTVNKAEQHKYGQSARY